MSNLVRLRTAVTTLLFSGAVALPAVSVGDERDELKRDFKNVVRPFVKSYCACCHGKEKPKAKFDLSPYVSLDSVAGD